MEELLKSLKLDDETVKKIKVAHDAELAKKAKENEEAATQIENFKTQLEQRNKDLKDLQKNAGDNEELTNKLKEMQELAKEQEKTFKQEMEALKKNNAVELALTGQVHDAKLTSSLLDLEKVEVLSDGTLKGLEDQVEALKEDKGFLFVPTETGDARQDGKEGNPTPKIVGPGLPSGNEPKPSGSQNAGDLLSEAFNKTMGFTNQQ